MADDEDLGGGSLYGAGESPSAEPYYGLAKQATALGGRYNQPSVVAIVNAQIAELQKGIDVRKELLKKLDENKETKEILDLLRKVGI